jgi:hypothetical protein
MKKYLVWLIWQRGKGYTPVTLGNIYAKSEKEALEIGIAHEACKDLIVKGYTLWAHEVVLLTCLENSDLPISWTQELSVIGIKVKALNQEQFDAFLKFIELTFTPKSVEMAKKLYNQPTY